ncbi:MAG: hypothetical protein ACJZ62_03655 [Candidatus Pelagibacterales bacterium]
MNNLIPKKKLFFTDERIAIIDIGSDTVRFQIFENFKDNQVAIFNKKITCGLGKDLIKNNKLNKDSIKKAMNALYYIKELIDSSNIKNYEIFATEAVRVAKNRDAFIADAENILKKKIHVLTGDEEAKFSAMGCIVGLKKSNGLVADLGGGSLELAEVKKKEIMNTLSLPLGVHRAKSKNNKIIDKFKSSLQNTEWLNENKFKRVILTGGTWRALVKLYFDKYNYPLKVIHHFKPDFDNFVLMLEEVSNFKKKDLLQYSLITKDKTPFIRYAAKLALEIINKVSAKQVVISYTAIREGYISDKIKLNYKNDPLEYQSLKVAAIANELNSRAVNFKNIKLFTNNFFKKRSYLNKRIRESAANYITTGDSIARDERGLFVFKQIIKSEILKFSHSDRVMLATIIFVFHNGINYNEIKDYRKIINKNKLLSSIELGLFLRIVYEIGQLSNFNYSNISIYVKDSNLIFSIPKNYSELLNSRFNKFILMLSKHKKLSQKIIFV